MSFPPDKKKPAGPPKPGGPPQPGGPPGQPGDPNDPNQQPAGPGLSEALMRPQVGPKPGQGMDPMAAMMGGMGDISQFGPPPPPAPGAPMGPDGGMPIGGGPMEGDPGMDPNMEGSGLFQALQQQLGQGGDQYASPPMGHGELDGMGQGDPGMGAEQLLAMLALARSGAGGPPMGAGGGSPSGLGASPSNPGQMIGMQNPNLMM